MSSQLKIKNKEIIDMMIKFEQGEDYDDEYNQLSNRKGRRRNGKEEEEIGKEE
jgi:hypothetical protein